MLKLEGNAAAVMLVAKGGMNDFPGTQLQRLQAAIATTAGLSNSTWVEPGQVLRIVAELHDRLVDAKLLLRPAQSLLETFRAFYTLATPSQAPSPSEVFLSGLMSSITCMRMAEDGVRLVEWESGLPTGFLEEARQLIENAVPTQPASTAA